MVLGVAMMCLCWSAETNRGPIIKHNIYLIEFKTIEIVKLKDYLAYA